MHENTFGDGRNYNDKPPKDDSRIVHNNRWSDIRHFWWTYISPCANKYSYSGRFASGIEGSTSASLQWFMISREICCKGQKCFHYRGGVSLSLWHISSVNSREISEISNHTWDSTKKEFAANAFIYFSISVLSAVVLYAFCGKTHCASVCIIPSSNRTPFYKYETLQQTFYIFNCHFYAWLWVILLLLLF